MQTFATLAALVAAASALQITAPTLGANIDLSGSNTVTWTSVSSDPSSFDLYLVNNGATPPSNKTLATGVQTSLGSYTFTNIVSTPGDKYVIEAQSNSTHNTGILSISQTFNVTKSGVASTTTSPTSSVTGTGTQSGSKATPTNGSAASKTFGLAAPVAALLAMLL